MVDPPFEAGGVKVTVACALPRAALAPVGAPGTEAQVTATVFTFADPTDPDPLDTLHVCVGELGCVDTLTL